ncbi:SigB/SigF/SigG family RNA polymerase sigma factor [Allokutzneria multivorans]|uniref:SigB/SigF/SigG family RNA polymerase sigma factor n=1 Tax=Allokutzneria multivorans TaxID=1142134 RepID=A0ABP7TF35_9PSEU
MSPQAEKTTKGGYEQYAPVFAELAALDPDDPARTEVRDRLVTGHLPVAKHIARRFANRGENQEDLTQVATLGLINAVDRFDPERGVDFLSFAVPTIMGEVRRHFRDTSWAVRVPRRLKEMHLSISAAVGELSQRMGRAPTPSEIATHLGVSREEVFEGLEATNAYRSASLDDMLLGENDGVSLGDALGEEDEGMADVERRESLQPLLERLPERERTIVVLRFFGNMTQTQIADRVGISQMHVSRLLSRTLAKLRDALDEE